MKKFLIFAFLVFFPSFFLLNFYQVHDFFIMLFGFLNGLGLGMFWLGGHSYEMLYTQNLTRDFYSSIKSVGLQIIQIIAPFFATLSFLISEKIFHIDSFTVLFWILPFLFFIALPFIFQMPDFIPEKIQFSHFQKLLFNPKNRKINAMYLFDSVEWVMLSVLLPFITLNSLKTVVNIGIFETVLGVITIFVTIFLSHVRTSQNRSYPLFYGASGVIFAYILLCFFDLSPYVYIIFTLISLFFTPIWNVTLHTIHLASVEYMKDSGKSSFYAELLYRDLILSIGRLFNIFILWIIFSFIKSNIAALKTSLIVLIVLVICKYLATRKVNLLIK